MIYHKVAILCYSKRKLSGSVSCLVQELLRNTRNVLGSSSQVTATTPSPNTSWNAPSPVWKALQNRKVTCYHKVQYICPAPAHRSAFYMHGVEFPALLTTSEGWETSKRRCTVTYKKIWHSTLQNAFVNCVCSQSKYSLLLPPLLEWLLHTQQTSLFPLSNLWQLVFCLYSSYHWQLRCGVLETLLVVLQVPSQSPVWKVGNIFIEHQCEVLYKHFTIIPSNICCI